MCYSDLEGAVALPETPATWAEGAEIVADVGVLGTRYSYQLHGADTTTTEGVTPVPSLGVFVPIGPVGVGLAGFAPFGRGGQGPDARDPGRYHAGRTSLQVLEGDLSLAVHPHADWTFGAGFRLAYTRFTSTRIVDTGTVLYGLAGPEGGVPLQDPFLEGTQQVDLAGVGFSWSGGARFRHEGWGADLAVRGPLAVDVAGSISYIPSNDLSMRIEGQAVTHFHFPADVALGMRLPVGRSTLGGEAAWIGWSSASLIHTELSDLRVTSSDATMETLLDSYGITDAAFLGSLDEVVTNSGTQDIVTGGAWIEVPLGERGRGRLGAWYAPTAIPEDHVHPGNVDFATADVRIAAARSFGTFEGALSLDAFFAGARDVQESVYSPTNRSSTGTALPPGEGLYSLFGARLGVELAWKAPPRG